MHTQKSNNVQLLRITDNYVNLHNKASNLPSRVRSKIEFTSSCWNWKAYCFQGYGRLRFKGFKTCKAHRIIYQLLVARIPDNLTIDHLCKNRSCVNPAHMEPVTLAENQRRAPTVGTVNRGKTHCPKGHEYTSENTYYWNDRGNQARRCRTCGGYKLLAPSLVPAEMPPLPPVFQQSLELSGGVL